MGEYYIWEVPKRLSNIEVTKKMNYIGGDGVIIGDTKVWTNSEEVKRSIHEEIHRRTIKGKIVGNEDGVPWGRIVGEAMRRQVENRELGEVNVLEKEEKYQPGIMLIEMEKEVSEVYYVASFGNYWDELSNRKLDKEEVVKARLEELRQVYQHKVYRKVPIQECWDVTGKNPITVRWLGINKGDEDNKE